MERFTAINASSRKTESPIHTSFPAECVGTQSALDDQGINHVIDFTAPSPPLLLRTSELNYSPISKPFEDTRTTSPTWNKPKDTVKTRIPLPHGFSPNVTKPYPYVKRREYSSFFLPTWCSSSGPSEQVSDHEATDEYINHQVSKERQESHFSRDWYPDKWMLQLIDTINSQPLTCKKIARHYTAAFKHDLMAKILARHNKKFASLDLIDQARVIKSSANISLPPKKPIRSAFWATVMQTPADIYTPSINPPRRKLAASTQDSTNPISPQTCGRKDFWATVMQAPADINTPSKKPPKRKLAALIQDSENSTPPQAHAKKDFWAIAMQTSETNFSSEKFLRNNSSGTNVRNPSSTSRKKRPRKEFFVAEVQKSAFSTSSRKRPRRDFRAVCLYI
ncbi:hypothetical protein BGAL_0306g00110 [Botrytis galanthina]|uniref:Uncharacterized protein n=1 Tax=Botrytis galanthina TaxID=278940 RepID=A0A4V6T6W6_9HELO|nr:hypothetical protein BGAL_0306g00110 [Botrytis galanthina]